MGRRRKQAQVEVDTPPPVTVPDPANSPVRRIDGDKLKQLGLKLGETFMQYRADRRIAEERWLRNQRQYLGIYDPEIEKELSPNRSKAYPKITRIKCISVLSRLMNLMFPGNESNWELKASPSPDLSVADVKEAMADKQARDAADGIQSKMDLDWMMGAIQTLANKRAEDLTTVIEDQLEELGGDQSYDYIQLNRKAIQSGILYGLGLLRGPFAVPTKRMQWTLEGGQPSVKEVKGFRPMFEFLPVWDFYPDMSAKTLAGIDGYFTRVVMTRSQLRKLCDRDDFFESVIKSYLSGEGKVGNYKALEFETQLRSMGVKINTNDQKTQPGKYEIIVWHGPISGEQLRAAGCDEIKDDELADEIDAEVWLVGNHVIKCDVNPWRALDVDVKTVHHFLFDEDDTSPIGQGLPNVIRDSQMSVAAASRMLLDNASVICGPNLEVNMDLLLPNQDVTSTTAYKVWYREGLDASAQFPAVRDIKIESHIEELLQVIELYMKFADAETFVGPATGGDMDKAPSEPMRTAAGASMLRSDAALPFKDIVRAFDSFTQSIIESLVQFNKKFNPERAPEGDYNVIARGATSLIAKEVRGMQMDQLVQTLTPDELLHIDDRKLATARLKVRDMGDLLVSEEEADRRKQNKQANDAATQKAQMDQIEATTRKLLSDAYKNIAQGQKNAAAADAEAVSTALDVLEVGVNHATGQAGAGGSGGEAPPQPGDTGDPGSAGVAPQPSGGSAGSPGGMPPV